ncbi:hypothetical protein [Streptomyces coelicoflavus]|uniref:hypothetical protein n=1 Tax=Streptomyces coelicoflavus TaxID=285562 RepID=UPI002E26E003
MLGCEVGDLLIPEPERVTRPGEETVQQAAVAGAGPLMVSHHRGLALAPADVMAHVLPAGKRKPPTSCPDCFG